MIRALHTNAVEVDSSWRNLFIIGGIAAFVSLAGTLADIIISMIPGWEVSTIPGTIQDWFTQFRINPLLGLRNLDILNITISAIGLPMYIALYGVHRHVNQANALLALVVTVMGAVVFITNNTALPMLELSRQYSTVLTDSHRSLLEAAGAALLARGSHGSFGTFIGFFLSSVGTFLMCLVMLQGRVFSTITSWIGTIGSIILTIYTVGATFLPEYRVGLVMVAMVGGLLMMAWNIMVALRLIQLSHPSHNYAVDATLSK